jgi:WD40 repeat protein
MIPPPSLLSLRTTQLEKAVPKEGPPDSSLRLNWIYGYESEKTRNTVQYTASGDVVYTCGHYVILYDMKVHKQRFFTGHTETVLCLTMHPKGKIAATGEAGMHPRVIVWETDSREILFSDRDFHRDGIIHVSFSGDGRLLGTIGNDVYHSLALFDWDKNELLFTTFVDKGICLSITFSHDDVVVVGGDSYINFYTKAPEGYVCRRGNFSRHSSLQPITTLEPLHGTTECVVAGTITGQLFLWIDRNCLRVIKGHDGSVNCMSSSEHGIVTGGEDKRIRMWTNTLDPGATFDVTYFGLRAFLRSVSMSIDGNTLVFGTLGASIFEISTVDGSDLRGGPIVTGHYTGDMQGVATNPCKHEFATVGDDRHLRIWDMKTKSLLKIATFDAYATCATYGPLGDVICVGLGGDATVVGKSGAYVVINEEDLTVVHEARDSSVPISLVAFSPEGETLAVGTTDGSIYLYAVLDEYELIGRCVRHKAPVCAVDFSVDGEWLRSNSDGNDLCFFNSDDASYQSNLASMRDVRWASVTCKFSWHTRNVHRTAYDGETVMKLHAPAPSSKFVGTATNYGYLNLFPYPSQHENARPRRTLAHYGDVAGFMFSYDGKRLLTAGRKDRCVIQWDVTSFKKDDVMEPMGGYASDDHDLECRTGEEIAADFMAETRAEPPGVLNNAPSAGYKKNEMRDLELNIWKEQITEPLHPSTLNKNVPAVSLRLEHVFGYKGHGMRGNVRYAEDGKVVYVVGGMGIALDRDTKKQTFYRVHDDAITSFASDKTGTVVATSQLGMAPKITVWRTKTMKAVWTSPDLQEASVSCLVLGERGLIAAAGIDVNHCITIYDWKRNILLARTYAGPCHVNALAFSPDCSELLAVGVKDIKIWDVTERTMCPRRPVLGKNGRVQAHLCCVYFTGMPCVGTSDGNLYFIKDDELNKALQAHDGPVNAMHVSKSGTQMVTGGRDGAVRIWNSTHDCTKELFLQKIAPRAESFKIKGVAFHNDEGTVVVGTRGSEILEIEIKSGSLFGNSFLVAGHGRREVHGLATHPKKDVFVSCGDDNTMRVWSGKDNSQTRVVRLDCAARCAVFSPDGRLCAIGLGGGAASGGDGSNASSKVGSFMVFESGVFKKEYEAKDSTEPIRAIRFSPDSRILAVGSEDSRIILYNVRDNYTRRAQILTHRAPVVNIDFSVDGMFIISQVTTLSPTEP